jgi:GABA(A) receptor-associated protein
MMKFKEKHSLETRKEYSRKIHKQYSDRIPIIIERIYSESNVRDITNTKYLVAYDATVAVFILNIRRQVILQSGDGIFIFCGKQHVLVTGSTTFQHLYENYKDEDGFLYMVYAGENVFG